MKNPWKTKLPLPEPEDLPAPDLDGFNFAVPFLSSDGLVMVDTPSLIDILDDSLEDNGTPEWLH